MARALGRAFGLEGRVDPGAVAAWLVPVVLIVYISLQGGGFDPIERGEVGFLVWWVVLIGTLVGAFAARGYTLPGRILMAVLAAFAGWTALSLGWSESAERSAIELARAAIYLGFFVLALAIVGRRYWRAALSGSTAAVGVVIALAVLSRLQPNWFPESTTAIFIPDIELESRLAYPLNYSSGLATMTAIGLPLLLFAAASGRSLIGRALAAAALPVAALALWLTGSSLALPLATIGVLAYLVVTDQRLVGLASLVPAAIGGAILILALEAREALDRAQTTSEALRQGDEVLVIALVVCAAVMAAQTGLVHVLGRWQRPAWLSVSPRVAAAGLATALAVVVVAGVAAGAPGKLSDRWDEFRAGEGVEAFEGRGEQVLDVSARGRYQYWEAAVDAYRSEPVTGIGPGSFEFWWAREGVGEAAIFVVDAHSLYLETLAELGIIGLLLIAGFVAAVLAVGAVRAWRATEHRAALAAAVAGCAVFAVGAGVDWMWELAAIPAVFMFLAAIAIAGGSPPEAEVAPGSGHQAAVAEREGEPLPAWRRLAGPALVGVLSVVALVAIGMPLAGTSRVDESRVASAAGDLGEALDAARDAVSIQPYAATPRIQEALVLERLGRDAEAVQAAREATEREPTHWRPWFVLSGIEARRGNAAAAIEAFEEARALFPRLQLPE